MDRVNIDLIFLLDFCGAYSLHCHTCFTYNINFILSINRLIWCPIIQIVVLDYVKKVFILTGVQMRTVMGTFLVGTQVVTEAVILSMIGVWPTQGAKGIAFAILVICPLKWTDYPWEISSQYCKRVFPVMRVKLSRNKVACCSSILNMILPLAVNLWLIRFVPFYFCST